MTSEDSNEALREAAALGNDRALKILLQSPSTDINSQNRVNGWTALHWAAKRGHAACVRELLNLGADSSITTTKGETPLKLCKSADVIALLGGEVIEVDNDDTHSKTSDFVPTYLTTSDPHYLWTMPTLDADADTGVDEVGSVAVSTSSQADAEMCESVGVSPMLMSQPKPQPQLQITESQEPHPQQRLLSELLIYRNTKSPVNLLGAIMIRETDTVQHSVKQMAIEIDAIDVGVKLSLFRHNGVQCVPVNRKQYVLRTRDVFSPGDLAVVVIN
ncbi:Ankyrin repeat domain-containing protein 40 [Nowakowskiella sp. JEL0078]|nr:Ankyrin repeat domain-containing protein 40 [Nowakowskiella sp. JEL0078]